MTEEERDFKKMCDNCIHKTFFEMSEYEYAPYCDDFNEELETIHENYKRCPGSFVSETEIKEHIKELKEEIRVTDTDYNDTNAVKKILKINELQKKVIKLYEKNEGNDKMIKLEQENQKLKTELCQLKGVVGSKDSQINLFKEEIKNIKREFNKRLISEKEQVLELLKNAEV